MATAFVLHCRKEVGTLRCCDWFQETRTNGGLKRPRLLESPHSMPLGYPSSPLPIISPNYRRCRHCTKFKVRACNDSSMIHPIIKGSGSPKCLSPTSKCRIGNAMLPKTKSLYLPFAKPFSNQGSFPYLRTLKGNEIDN
jgi:hypothetical protein